LTTYSSRVHTIHRAAWDKMGTAARRSLFSTGSIHVVGPCQGSENTLEGIESWDAPEQFAQYFDLEALRFVQGISFFNVTEFITYCIILDKTRTDKENSDASMFKAPLTAHFDELARKRKKQILNFLDVGLQSSFLPPIGYVCNIKLSYTYQPQTYRFLQDGFSAANIHTPNFSWRTPWPHSLFSWALIASKAAISDTHVDGEGLATFIRCILGEKLWCVALDDKPPGENGWPLQTPWQIVHLKAQDDL
jgi:hypothetical protein